MHLTPWTTFLLGVLVGMLIILCVGSLAEWRHRRKIGQYHRRVNWWQEQPAPRRNQKTWDRGWRV